MMAEVNPLSAPADRWCTALDLSLPLPFRSTCPDPGAATLARAISGTAAVLGIDVIGAFISTGVLSLQAARCYHVVMLNRC